MIDLLPSLVAAIGLAVVNLIAGHLRFLDMRPRARWLSAAGGIAVAYVFLHLLPELSHGQDVIIDAVEDALIQRHVYLIALLGLAFFYGLEHLALVARSRRRSAGEEDTPGQEVFWIHTGSYALYYALIGYLLVTRQDAGLMDLTLFTIAIAVHVAVNDRALCIHHRESYERGGRWVMAAAVLAGWAAGSLLGLGETVFVVLLAFVTGAIVLTVLKEELPAEKESNFPAFALGAGVYALLLLIV